LSRFWTVMPCGPIGRTSAASNFHIKASHVRTRGMIVRTIDLMHANSISDARTSGPRWLVSGRLDLNCNTCLKDERVRTRIHVVQTVAAIFPYLCFGKKSWSLVEHWVSSGRAAEMFGRLDLNCDTCLKDDRVRMGIHVVRAVAAIFPYLCFGKKSWSLV
jgi:hypothetical protein